MPRGIHRAQAADGDRDVLIFDNIDAEGRPHPLMLHAGEPVTEGAKWIAMR